MERKLEIIAETPDFLVINKPAGLLTHGDGRSDEETLTDLLIKKYPEIKNTGDPERPGIAHRLDRDTSGILLAARTPKMYEHLKRAFKEREIKKEYLALVRGKLSKNEGEIKFAIARSRRGGRMAARPETQEGRTARTSYEVVKRLANSTLVRAFPETGRTHQLRAHFYALGHPIVGDKIYRRKRDVKKEKTGGEKAEERRLMLHAAKISFPDLKGETQTFTAPLPPEFKKL